MGIEGNIILLFLIGNLIGSNSQIETLPKFPIKSLFSYRLETLKICNDPPEYMSPGVHK